MKRRLFVFGSVVIALLLMGSLLPILAQDDEEVPEEPAPPTLLTDPMLQLPGEDSVYVVWFTEFEGEGHTVTFGESLDQTVEATTTKLSRVAEDNQSWVGEQNGDGTIYPGYTPRDIWRHEAQVTGLERGVRVPYFVTSIADDGTEIISDTFSLQPLPAEDQNLTILLTSDHQLKAMTPANLQMAEMIAGPGNIDAVFYPGDLQNIPDRASEWFDDNRGWAFFPGLQGNGGYTLETTRTEGEVTYNTTRTYYGGEIIQNAPLFTSVGNHEVMGRLNTGNTLGTQYNDPQPRAVAEARYEQIQEFVNPDNDPAIRDQWITNNSFNNITYQELFTLPDDSPGGENYWAMQYGDVYIVSLYSTRIWRTPSLGDNARGKYREPLNALNTPDNWGYGDFIFEDLAVGSDQYEWLVDVLASEEFQNARYKVVLMHQGPHGVGDNVNPVMAHPVQVIDYNDDGSIAAVRYEYPIEEDIVYNDVLPLFNEAGVNLVHTGHSHVWWRMQNESGVNFIETSNVGNNYGCYLEGYRERGNVPNDERYNANNYVAAGDPHGLEPIMPSVFSPMTDEDYGDLPCIASNDLTAFSLFTTEDGMVRSYVFDTRDPNSEPILFDEFSLTEMANP
ncbi:MAG: metallophosphoesterase [Anaerolineae bacterium]